MSSRLFAVALLLLASRVSAGEPATPSPARQQDCEVTRQIEYIVIKLVEENWSTQRIIGTILRTSKVDDPETRLWFAELVRRVAAHRSVEDIDTQFAMCMRAEPDLSESALSRLGGLPSKPVTPLSLALPAVAAGLP